MEAQKSEKLHIEADEIISSEHDKASSVEVERSSDKEEEQDVVILVGPTKVIVEPNSVSYLEKYDEDEYYEYVQSKYSDKDE